MGEQVYSYEGMTKDLAKSKKNPKYYYDGQNVRILSTDEETTLALTPEKGNTLIFTLADHYSTPAQALQSCVIDKYIIFFVYYSSTYQEIRRVDTSTVSYVQKTLIGGNLNFQLNTFISTEVFYENENILKVYWADGVNPLRYINILNPVTDISLLDVCPSFIVSSPELESISWGGLHTAGMIQYCYNLVIKNGAQTKVSPRSELIPLKKQIGGGDVNEIVGQINHIKIDNVDTKFDIIRLYSIKYTSYNQSPVISLISEESISKTGEVSTTVRFVDDGTTIYGLSEKELLFLGGENIIPAHIASKFNYLILGDIKENFFDVPIEVYDTRAYRFPNDGKHITKIKNKDGTYKDIQLVNGNIVYVSNGNHIEYTHDCINDLITSTVEKTYSTTYTKSNTAVYFTDELSELPFKNIYYPGIKFESLAKGNYIVEIDFVIDGIQTIYESPQLIDYNEVNIAEYVYNKFQVNNGDVYPETYILTSNIGTYGTDYGIIFTYAGNDGTDVTIGVRSVKVYSIVTTVVEFDALNKENIYVYRDHSQQQEAGIYGATGSNIELIINQTSSTETTQLLKSREVYRFAIEFYNNRGQYTPPKWICDLVIPDGNLNPNLINRIDVTLNNVKVLYNLGVVGWRLLRVERTDADKTVITQGIINPCIFQEYDVDIVGQDPPVASCITDDGQEVYNTVGLTKVDDSDKYYIKMPSPFMRNMQDLKDDTVTTITEVPPFPLNGFIDAMWGQTYTPKINAIKNGNIISYPIMGGELSGDIEIPIGPDGNAITIINYHYQNANFPFPEIFKKKIENELTSHETYQFTEMFQMYSPELIFVNPIFGNNLQYTIVGKLDNTLEDCGVWGKQVATADDVYYLYDADYVQPDLRGNVLNDILEVLKTTTTNAVEAITSLLTRTKKSVIIGEVIASIRAFKHFHLFNTAEKRSGGETYSSLHKSGLIGTSGGRSPRQNLYQYYRKYTLNTTYTPSYYQRSILGNPEVIGKGESSQIYQGVVSEDKYTFHNHLFTLITDENKGDYKETQSPILSVNSIGANCLNIVDSTQATLESILTTAGIYNTDSTALVEVRRTLTNQYGGNTYESRSRNRYLRIGKFESISATDTTSTQSILKAGDIFVGNFKFQRIIPNIAQVQNNKYTVMCEIVEFPVESSINSSCRNDYSLSSWDNSFHPSFDEYHNYNRVYSQEPISDVNIATPFTFEEVKQSSVRLLSTKVKTPGEIVDGWTDTLVNEELNLNGQYGKLTRLIRNNDELYFFQDNALGVIMVKPRVALQANDGIGVELGTGQILYNYQYLSTASGSNNPNCIFTSTNYIYYPDVTNRTLNRVSTKGVEGISDPAGFHVYMYNNMLLSYENSLSLVGIFDNVNDDAYFCTPGFTLVYNEGLSAFTSYYTFTPQMLIKVPGKIYSSNNGKDIYQHLIGDYGKFYGTVYDSSITIFANPQQNGGTKTRFDNLQFNAEVSNNTVDVFYDENTNTYTVPLKSIQVTTDYQQSLDTTLTWGSNIKRRFRNWSLVIPRAYDTENARVSLDRMRGEWAYIKLTIDNTDNYKKVLHDIILSYA